LVIIDIVLIREYLAHELKTKRIQESAQNIDQFCDILSIHYICKEKKEKETKKT